MATKLLLATLLLSALSLAGCSSGDGAATIEIHGSAFDPSKLTVKAGTQVHVENHDGITHTVTADAGAFNTGNVAGGADGHFDAPAKGTYGFHCAIHGGMKGTLTVT